MKEVDRWERRMLIYGALYLSPNAKLSEERRERVKEKWEHAIDKWEELGGQ